MGKCVNCILTTVLLAGPGLEAQAVDGDTAACFDVELGEWVGSVEWFDSLVYSVPPRILMDPRPDATANPDDPEDRITRRLAVPEGALPTPHRRAGWNRLSADSARMYWTTGFVGVRARVGWAENGFAGSAQTFTDMAGQPFLTTWITGTTVDCDSPPVFRLSDQRPLIRTLSLQGGDSLTLRAIAWDESTWSEYRPLTYQGTPRLAPPFDSLVVAYFSLSGLDESVRRISVVYGSASDYERLKRHLITIQGEPTRIETTYPTVPEMLIWENRTTRISLFHDRGGSHGPMSVQLILADPRIY